MARSLSDVGLGAVMESVLESAEDGIFVLNRAEELVLFNRACERLTGLSSEDVLDGRRSCDDVFRVQRSNEKGPPSEAGSFAITELLRSRRADTRAELILISRAGERRFVEGS